MRHTCKLCKKKNVGEDHHLTCPNCHFVEDNVFLALPYQYEDFANERELSEMDQEKVFGQTYHLKTLHPSMKVETRQQIGLLLKDFRTGNTEEYAETKRVFPLQKTLGRGVGAPDLRYGTTYTIRLQQMDVGMLTKTVFRDSSLPYGVVSGDMVKDTIYKGNNSRKIAELAKRRKENPNKIVFWPDLKKMEYTVNEMTYPMGEPFLLNKAGGALKVTIDTYDTTNKAIRQTEIRLKLVTLEKQNVMGYGRRMASYFSKQLKLKGILDPRQHVAFYGKDSDSTEVRIIVESSGDNIGAIKDIEVSVVASSLRIIGTPLSQGTRDIIDYKCDYKCDPHDYNQVAGLVRALEDHVKHMNANDPDEAYADNVYQLKSAIDQYRIGFEKGHEAPVAQINSAVQLLWDAKQIGRRGKAAFDDDYYESLEKKRTKDLIYLAENTSIPKNVKFGSKAWATGARGKAKGRIRALEKILLERREDEKNQKLKEQIEKALDEIQRELIPAKPKEKNKN